MIREGRLAGSSTPLVASEVASMTGTVTQICELLHEAAETHHRVFRIVDGGDADWASWYTDWLDSPHPGSPRRTARRLQ